MKRMFRILSVLLLALTLAGFSYRFLHQRALRARLTALYEQSFLPPHSAGDIFDSKAMLEHCDSLLQTAHDSATLLRATQYKAEALIKEGEEARAIPLLQGLLQASHPGIPEPTDVRASGARRSLALAWLRLGERNNCLAHHTTASCIFPIQDEGIYIDPEATQKSIGVYSQLLQKDPGDLQSRWLLNLAYMTIGTYPRAVPPAWLIPGLDKDTASVKLNAFQDKAPDLHLTGGRHMAGGTIVDDFDNDGYLDIVTSCWGWGPEDGMHFFHNNRDGTFSDQSAHAGISGIKGSLNIQQVDYNNDGYLDIFVLRGGWKGIYGCQPKTLLRNNGDGTFTDVTVESGLVSPHPTQTSVWADFNNDGWPDVFIGHESTSLYNSYPCELWINNRDGTFTETAQTAGCATSGFVKGVTAADYDKDGWPDIFLSQRDGAKVLFRNKGIKGRVPQFENATHRAGLDKDTTYTFPTWFWDYDNDGWPDLFVGGYQTTSTIASVEGATALGLPVRSSTLYLYHNNHDGTFSNVTKATGLNLPVFAMGSNFGDIDNDGWLDIYLGTGNPDFESLSPNRLLLNRGGHFFTDVTRSARVGNLQKGHGVAFADLDNDGDQDIFIVTGGAYKGDAWYNSCYINPGQNSNSWIGITLEGTCSCRSAIGAHIIARFTDNGIHRTIYRDVNSGGSFGSSPLRQSLGLGHATVIDELEIRWPASGTRQIFRNVAPRCFIRIREDRPDITVMDIHRLDLKTTAGSAHPIDCVPPLPLSRSGTFAPAGGVIPSSPRSSPSSSRRPLPHEGAGSR